MSRPLLLLSRSLPRLLLPRLFRGAFLRPLLKLGLFPHRRLKQTEIKRLADMLNDVDWHELGFVCDGRFLFSQRSLEQALLPEGFAEFAVKGLV